MPLVVGERYRCPDADCGCEITVTRGRPAAGGPQPHLLLRSHDGEAWLNGDGPGRERIHLRQVRPNPGIRCCPQPPSM